MLDEYYKLWGWDENGVPTRPALDELGLSESYDFSSLLASPVATNWLRQAMMLILR